MRRCCRRGRLAPSLSFPAAPGRPTHTVITRATTRSTPHGTTFRAIAPGSFAGSTMRSGVPRGGRRRRHGHELYGLDDICFVGIGLPSAACNLARLTHAPKLKLVYESGTIETSPQVLPLSIGDGELCDTALTTVSVPEMFQYWLQGGRISVGFLGGAQVDRFGNLNSTVIGDYRQPKVRLPGGGGATEIATSCGQVYLVMRQTARSFVKQLDFLTTLGHGRTGCERRELGIATKGPA